MIQYISIGLAVLFFNLVFSQEYVNCEGGRGSFRPPMELINLKDKILTWTFFRFSARHPVINFFPNTITVGRLNKDALEKYLYFNDAQNERRVGVEMLFSKFKNTELHSKYGQSFQELVTIDLPEKKDHVFVMSGFSLMFDHENAKIKKLGIYEENGKLNILFGSTEPLSSFQWLVDYIYFPTNRLVKSGKKEGITNKGRSNKSFLEEMIRAKDIIYVIRGFKIEYELTSYLTSIGIHLENDGYLHVSSNCQDKPGHFKWMVDWAVIKKH